MGKLFNKVVLVTGGGSGIGAALALAAASEGARAVVVVDINVDAASKVSAYLPAMATNPGFSCGFDKADVGKEEDIQRVIESALSKHGSIDVYFSNAGILAIGGVAKEEYSNKAWQKIIGINVMSHIYAARHLFPLWKQCNYREGIFVVTASAAGLLAQIGSLPYHLTKHSAVSIADWLAISHRQDGVSVHCLCPQAVRTSMLTSVKSSKEGGPAGVDGVMEPSEVASITVNAIDEGKFLILPHPEVHKYFMRKASDYDRWIRGMQRVHQQFGDLTKNVKHSSKL